MNEYKGFLRLLYHARQTQLMVFIDFHQKILPGGKEQGKDFHSLATLIFCGLDCYLQEETYNANHTPDTCNS